MDKYEISIVLMSDRQVVPTGKSIHGYEVIGLVGVGGFGGIYRVQDNHSKKVYALKTENAQSKRQLLQYEIQILKEIKGHYFPKYIESGTSEKYNINYLIMSYFGASIGDIHSYHDYNFDINIAYNVSLKMLECIKAFHKFGFVHRDIKPGNFLIQQNPKYPIVLIDFNLSARHIDPNTNKPYPCKNEHMFLGTIIFASIDVLSSQSCGRKDDLIAWFYTFLYLACGSLPWAEEKDKLKSISMKKSFKVSDLNYEFPSQFQKIYDYLKKLEYKDKPDYKHIENLFESGMKEDKVSPDTFNWSNFIAKHSNMTKYEEKMSKMTLKAINDKNKDNNQRDKQQMNLKNNLKEEKASKNKKGHNKKHSKKGKKDDCSIA